MAASIHSVVGRCVRVLFHKKINQREQAPSRNSVSVLSNKYNYIFITGCTKTLQLSVLSANKIDVGVKAFFPTAKSNYASSAKKTCLGYYKLYPIRYFSVNNFPDSSNKDVDPSSKRPSYLMDFPEIIWPSLIYSVKNWILSKVIIRQYLDNDFDLKVFGKGAKQAFLLVTSLLMHGKMEELRELVSKDAFEEIKRNYSLLGLQQRQLFSITPTDVYFSYPYQVGIMLDDGSNTQKRFVEITMCFHCILGAEQIRREDPTMRELHKHKDKIVIGNCRFIKEYTKGCESDWTINIINYFRPTTNH